MQTTLVLSSHNVKKQTKNKPSDFTIRYNQPIILDPNRQYELGLGRIISMSFTWFNITSELDNQKIKYSSDGGKTWKDITFPPGTWNYVSFNNFIKEKTKTKTSDKTSYPITLKFNNTTFKTTINLATNYQLDLTTSNFRDLIGFNKRILTSSENVGDYTPNLSQDTEILNIHCDLISESLVDGDETDIIYTFGTNDLQPSYAFTKEPLRVQYYPVNKYIINTLRVYITDGKRRIIDLNDADTSFSLILREKKKKDNYKMPTYNYKRIFHPSLGRFVYKHKGSGLIVDNIFKPMKMIVDKVLKPVAKKALKSGIESAGDKLGKKVVEKVAEKSGHLFMKDLQSLGKQIPKATNKQKEEDYNVILNRLISGRGYKKQKIKKF